MKINKFSPFFLSFLQATGLVVYVGLVSLFFVYAETWFGKMDNFFGPMLMLLIFVISATISALLVLGKAGFLFWEKRYKESFTLLGLTLGWIFFYLILTAALIICQ